MVRPNNKRSSSEDRRSTTSHGVSRSTTPASRVASSTTHYQTTSKTVAPSIGSVKITRTEDFYQPPTSTLTTASTTRSRSQTRGRPYGDNINGRTSTADVAYHHKTGGSSSYQAGHDSSNGRPHHDMFVVGYATVTTHQRPSNSEGVNYKVHLDQQPRARTTVKVNTPIQSSVSASSARYAADVDDDYVTPLHSTYNRYQTTRSSVSPSSYTTGPRGRSYHTATSVTRSSRPSRSASLPRLDRSAIGVTSSHYTPSTYTEAWRPITSNGPSTTSTEYQLNGWKTKSTGSAIRRSRDVTDHLGDKELYERVRARHLQPTTSLLNVSEYEPHRSTVSHHTTSTGRYGLPDVIYTSNKIDRGLIADRPTYVQRTASVDYPSRYSGFEPTDVNVVVLPNGQRAVTYTKHSQTGHGDHQLANVEIEKIIRRTKPLQDSLHTLEEFVKRNRSLFPENILIYQNIKFFLLNEEELRRIGERPDAQVYGVKIRERLVVPYGTEIVDILRRHYSRYREVEVEYEDVNRIRVLAKEAEAPRAGDHLQTKDSIRRIVETEYEERDASTRSSRRQPHHQTTVDYQTLKTLEAVKATPLPSTLEFEHEVINSKHELQRLQSRTKDLLTKGKAVDSHETGNLATTLEFTSKLRNRRIAEGNSVRLSCAINVATDVTVTWYHGANVVKEGGNFHLSQFYGLCSLDIGKVSKSDAGIYTVTATNVRGSVSCSAALEVEALEASDPLELNKPTFVNELESQVVDIGDKVVFKVQFTGHPSPTIQWLRDGLEVQEDSKTQVVTDSNGNSRLTIRDARQSDAGLYCCIAKNKHGASKCAANLRFKDTKGSNRQFADYDKLNHTRHSEEDVGDQSGSRPQFMAVPQSQIHVHEGEPLTLRCIVTGRPKPTVTWYRGVRELTYTQRYRILAEKDGHFMMQIPSTMQQTDSGEFSIVASNPNGSVKFTTYINILPRRPDAPVIGTAVDWSDIEEYKPSENEQTFASKEKKPDVDVVQVTAIDQHSPEQQTIELVVVKDNVASEESAAKVESAPTESAPTPAAEEPQQTVNAAKEEPAEKPVEAAKEEHVEKPAAVDVVEAAPEESVVAKDEPAAHTETAVVDEVLEPIVVDKQERIPKLESSKLLQEFADASPIEKLQDEPEEELLVMAEVPKQESAPASAEPLEEVSEAPLERVEKPKQEKIKLFDETDANADAPTKEVAEEPKEKGKKKKRKDDRVADEPEATKEEKEPAEEAPEEPKDKGKTKKRKDDKAADESEATVEEKELAPDSLEESKEKGKKKKSKEDKNAEEVEVMESHKAVNEETSEEPKEKSKKKKRKDDKPADESEVVEEKEAPSEEAPEESEEKNKEKESKDDEKTDEVKEEVPVIDEIQEIVVTKQERIPKLESIPLLQDFTDAPLQEKPQEVPEEEEIVMVEIPHEESAPAHAEPVEEASEAPVEKVEKPKQELKIFDEPAVTEEAEKPKEAKIEETPAEVVAIPEEPTKVDAAESKNEEPAAKEAEEESSEEEEESSEEEEEDEDKSVPTEADAPAEAEKEVPSEVIAPVENEGVESVDAKTEEIPLEVNKEEQKEEIKEELKEDKEKASVEEIAPTEKAEEKESEEESEEESSEEESSEGEEDDKESEDANKAAVETPEVTKTEDSSSKSEEVIVHQKSGEVKTEVVETKAETVETAETKVEEQTSQQEVVATSETVETKVEEQATQQEVVITAETKVEEQATQQEVVITAETKVEEQVTQQEVVITAESKVEEHSSIQEVVQTNETTSTKVEEKTAKQEETEEKEESEEEESEEEEDEDEEEEEEDDEAAAGEAPTFSTPLKSESVVAGGSATFVCSVTGKPEPTVEWYKGDVLLTASDRYVISVVDGQYSLKIVNIDAEDAGKYTVKVSNARGICRCTATLALQGEAPTFSTLLKSECIAAGESATFVCSVTGKPAPTVEWYKGDVLLTGSDRYIISVVDGQYSLKIENVGPDDAGQYTAKVSNASGICRCTATLALQDTEQVTTSRVVKETKTTVITSSSTEGMAAPKFQQFLQSVLATVETDATFKCLITAEPAPTITWSKGDLVLTNSEKVEIKSEGNQYSLILKKLVLEDGGQYTIKAQNEVGETSCTATLLVHDGDEDEYEIVTTEEQDMSMPSFTQFLKSQVVKQGATATLQCILDCQPNPPKIVWLFKGQPVSESDNVKILADDVTRTYSLTVQSLSAENEGEYTVTASTDCAEISSAASIVIQPEAQITVKTTTIVEKSATPDSADAAAGGISFVNYLQSQVVKVNDIAIFACQVKSDTPPQVTWFKDGTELSNSDKVSITPAGDKYCLTVLSAQKTDGGEYKIVLSTPTGRLSCTATLLVTDENVTIVRQEVEEESGSEYESEEEEEEEDSEEE